jgi:hypothetical protein
MQLKKSKIDGTVVRDFAARTLHNLRFIDEHYRLFREGKHDTEVYEVTQLINSMLGLLVFPKETFWNHLKPMKFEEIPNCPFKKHENAPNLRELIRLMRNSFSHFNLEIKAQEDKPDEDYIYAIEMYNINKQEKETWRDRVTVFELQEFIEWFIAGVIDSSLLDIPIEKIEAA